MAITPVDLDAYSPSSTIITFDSPVPLLRGPLPAGSSDDPSVGQFVLAFKDAQSWASAYKACESNITSQCEAGARIGCAIGASNKCKPPWWKTVFGESKTDLWARAKCEDGEMEICLVASREKCREFAKAKCLPAFRDARIASNDRKVNWKEASNLVNWASLFHKNLAFQLIGLGQLEACVDSKCGPGVTYYRGSDLLDAALSIDK